MYSRLLRLVLRFFAWWGGLFALLAGGSVCPCCGTPTCPGGAASAGLLSGLVAMLLYLSRWLCRRVVTVMRRRSPTVEDRAVESPSEVPETNRT